MPTYQPLANSSFLDFTGYRTTNATTVAQAYGFSDGVTWTPSASAPGINIALVLPRANDPTALLSENWGQRELGLQQLYSSGTLWSTYGATTADYSTVLSGVSTLGYGADLLTPNNSNYIASQASRTVWVSITSQAEFQALFNQTLMYSPSAQLYYWDASGPGTTNQLSLPAGWNVTGLWLDTSTPKPPPSPLSSNTVTLAQGVQSVGNSTLSPTTLSYSPTVLGPQNIAALYNFPLNGLNVQTGNVGLIEPGIGSALPNDQAGASFQSSLDNFLSGNLGLNGTGTVYTQGVNGQAYGNGGGGERSLDVGVVSAVNPGSNISLYNGSGNSAATGLAQSSVFTATQSAIWDPTPNRANVTSDSFGAGPHPAPGSPFYSAVWQLSIDAALLNQTSFIALGDGGSGGETGNGLTNVRFNATQPWNVMVGGTSLSTVSAAQNDPSLGSLFAPALAGNLQAIWQLVSAGLTVLPADAAAGGYFTEAVWNTYYVSGNQITSLPGGPFLASYLVNSAGAGGVDVTQPAPLYQTEYGLNPTTSDGYPPTTGRGVPDVSADAGGNLNYRVPSGNMLAASQSGGTSAASPLWASLAVQLNAIFNDQGLPNLGYMNDLLYTASAVDPASFNDVQLGNNISSFILGGSYTTINNSGKGVSVGPTGFGYSATPGYDLTTGLGSPNGLVLARTMTALAQAQMFFANEPSVVTQTASGAWQSGARESLLVQITLPAGSANVSLTAGAKSLKMTSGASGQYAWTSRFAGQVEQSYFDDDLVRLFDQQSQGALGQLDVGADDPLSIFMNGASAGGVAPLLTSAAGFADFQTSAGDVRLALPVAIAETADGLNNQQAILRVRGGGVDNVSVAFYRVDDLTGDIGTFHPGDAGYAAAAASRFYQLGSGGNWLAGPGDGNYEQAMLEHVNAGDIIAMEFTNNTHGNTFWAFAQANEQVGGQNVGHLWNYAMNAWGWEDTFGGGDRDFNDLVVQFDFTSNSGHGWIK
ncbi:MAG: hypothetical protein JO339_28455 [Alphaproteobacteria bacterium]|nr:hypothetical protein [Alphaproteobacteria bacterium]